MSIHPEHQVIAHLERIVEIDRDSGDSLPGEVIYLVRRALRVLRKRRGF